MDSWSRSPFNVGKRPYLLLYINLIYTEIVYLQFIHIYFYLDPKKNQVAAKQELENYCLQLLDVISEQEGLMEKLSENEKEKFEETVSEAMEWSEHNQELPASEYRGKKRELEKDLKGMMTKMYSQDTKGKKKAGGRRR